MFPSYPFVNTSYPHSRRQPLAAGNVLSVALVMRGVFGTTQLFGFHWTRTA